MISAGKVLKDFIKNQTSIEDLSEKLGVTRQTVYNILNGESISSEMIAKLLNETGFDFEKAFEVQDED